MKLPKSNHLSLQEQSSHILSGSDNPVGILTIGGDRYKVFPIDHKSSNDCLRPIDCNESCKLDEGFSSIVGSINILNKQYVVLLDTSERCSVSIALNDDFERLAKHETQKDLEALDLLTERELQVSKFAAKGLSNKEIAKQMCISEWTISTHLRRIYAKLGVSNRTAMVHKCFGK